MRKNTANNRFLKSIVTVLLVLMTSVFVACKSESNGNNSSTAIEKPDQNSTTWVLDTYEKTLFVDETFILKAFDLEGNDLTGITWKSEDFNIATVNNEGIVSGVKPGKTQIKAIYGEKMLACDVVVSFAYMAVPVLTLNNILDDSILLEVGQTFTLDPELSLNGEKQDVQFIVISESMSVIVNGLVLTANDAVENVKITISCTYQEKTYTIDCFVSAIE